jgi:hypothetical protein
VTNQDQQNGNASAPAPAQPVVLLSAKGAARRRFTRAATGAGGVLATLASTPGMAASVCTTPSGYLSSGMAMSHQPVPPPLCGGKSPGYWFKPNLHPWPAGITTDQKFKTVFHCNGNTAALGNLTMLEVCDPHPNIDYANTGRHILAAYINALAGFTTVLTTAMVLKIWNEYQSTGGQSSGYYTPSAGVKWYGPQIVDYICSTFHQPIP